MILIVDSGATKADWICIDKNSDILFSTQTLGLNPHYLSSLIINERIVNNFEIYQNRNKIKPRKGNIDYTFFQGKHQ